MPPLRWGRWQLRWGSPAGAAVLGLLVTGVVGVAWLGVTLFILAA